VNLSPVDALREIRRAYQYVELYQDSRLVLLARRSSHRARIRDWQSESRPRFRTSVAALPTLRGIDFLPLRDFEITWASDGRKQAEAGIGTFVVVRHIADTSRLTAPGEPIGTHGDSLLLGLVVCAVPGFSKDNFNRDWGLCLAGHFGLDPGVLWEPSNEPAPSERGCWGSMSLSLAQIKSADDFARAFGNPLVAKAVELARQANANGPR
jgi:hypothetical protein